MRYPDVRVKLVGRGGNAMEIIARVRKEMRRKSVPNDEIEEFTRRAASGDYDRLLRTCMEWVNVE